jgi:hypothetical protein
MIPDSLIRVSTQTKHEERCDSGKTHGDYPYNIEACYWCEELVTCHEAHSTNDESYPVICRECVPDVKKGE